MARTSGGRPPLGADFTRLWVAVGSSNLGDGLRLAAIPLLGAALTDSPALVGGLTAAVSAPWLLFALVSGAVVDCVDHRALLVAVSLARGGLVAGFAVLVWLDLGTIVLLYAVAVAVGTGETLFDNGAQAMLPRLVVDTGYLERANGRLVATEIAGNEAAGPAMGSALFAASPVAPFGLSGALGLVAAALAARIRPRGAGGRPGSRPERAAGDAAGPQPVLASIREGLGWVWHSPPLRRVTTVAVVLSLFDSAWFAILVLYATRTLEASELAFGLMLAAGGAGGVAGGFAAGAVARRLPTGASLAVATGVSGLAQLVLGLTGSVPVAVVAIGLSSAAFALFNVVAVSLRQRLVPEHMLGRVSSVYRFAAMGVAALGALAGGLVAEALGIRAAFLVGVPFLLGAAPLVLRVPDTRGAPG